MGIMGAVGSWVSGWIGGGTPLDRNSLAPVATYWTPQGAIQTRSELVPAYLACVSAISTSLSKVPLRLIRVDSKNGFPVRYTNATDIPLYNLLRYKPNSYQTSLQFRESLAVSLLKTGNAYAYMERKGGKVVAFHVISPTYISQVSLIDQNGKWKLWYRITCPTIIGLTGSTARDENSTPVTAVSQDEIIHITGAPSMNYTWRGTSVQESMISTLGLAAAQQDAAYSYLFNGGGSILVGKFTSTVKQEDQVAWVANTRAALSNQGAGGQVFVSDTKCTLERVPGLAPDAQQYIESRISTATDICMIMLVPPPIIGLNNSLKYNTYQEQWSAFRTQCLDTYARRIEESFEDKLIPLDQRDALKIEHDFDSLMRGDPVAKLKLVTALASIQCITVNEVRMEFDLAPLSNGNGLALPAGAKMIEEEPKNVA